MKSSRSFFLNVLSGQGLEPVTPPTGDRALSPLGWATGSCRPLGGRQAPFFFSRDFVANLKKKNYI